MNRLVRNGLHLRITKFTIATAFFTLLLTIIQFSVVQGTPARANAWQTTDNVVDEASVFFDDSYIHEIRLYFEDPDWYDILFAAHDYNRSTADPYFPAAFVSHGIEINPVGARFKGFSTFGFNTDEEVYEDIKKSFRIDFNIYSEGTDEETTFFGLKKLNLNNCKRDPSLIREKLFMDFASNYMPAPRSVYTHVYVNDEYLGLYLALEHIDNTFVETRFGFDESGNIFKAVVPCSLHYLGPDPKTYDGPYELKNNEEINNWSDLIELTDVLTNTPISELPEKLEPIFDVKSAMYSLAVLDLFVSLDSYIGYANNYYLYHRSDTGQFTYLVWDADLAFGGFWMTLAYGTNKTQYRLFPPSVLSGFGTALWSIESRTLVLVKNAMAVEAYNRTYLRALAQMLREGFDADSVRARSEELSDLIRGAVYSDPNLWTDASEFDSEIEKIIDFVEKRAAFIDAQLDFYAQKTDLQINDLMTVNQNTIADNMGDYDPWVEIYNLGPGTVNSNNIFLTDDLEVPNKWKIPVQNLDDGELKLLWLDGEPTEGIDHSPFRIEVGDKLYLYYLTDDLYYVLVDSLSVPRLDADVSYGRFPDGEGLWYLLNDVVTPAQSNQFDFIPDGLVINEFMANNDNSVAGPSEDYPDWIELYNGGSVPVNVGNLYLTDNLLNADMWRFPEDTIIEPGGFLVVWADNSSEKGTMHTCFSLNATGETIGLFSFDRRTKIDSVVFGQQLNDVSYARPSDRGSIWSYWTPTFGSSNYLGKRVAVDGIYINEFMASNAGAVAGPFADYPDWIELYNGGNVSVDVGGMYLTDDLSNPDAWQFPEGAVIKPGDFLVVWADNTPQRGSLHTSFSLNVNGEAIGLFTVDGETEVDSVVFDQQFDDVSYSRLLDGNSSWGYLTSTFRVPNKFGNPVIQSTDAPGKLFINEFMANNDGAVEDPEGNYPDWIEICNLGNGSINLAGMYLTDDLSNRDAWQFPPNTFIEPGDFLVVWADNAPEKGRLHTSISLNARGEIIAIYASDSETLIDSIVFGEQFNDISYGRLSEGSSSWDYLTPTPNLSNAFGSHVPQPVELLGKLFINEFMANNDGAVEDPEGNYPDWIEICNLGNGSINLAGMYLTDDLSNPNCWQFPENVVIDPSGFLIVWTGNSSENGLLHASFNLNANGDAIGLFAIDGRTEIDSVIYEKQFDNISYARLFEGSLNWDYSTPTPNMPNIYGDPITKIVDVPGNLFINEFMASNTRSVAGPNDDYPDWIELYNGDSIPVDVGGMYLTDDLDNPTVWQFPDNTTVEAGGYLLVWADNSSYLGGLHASFGLNANGEAIGLFASDGMTLIDSVIFSRQLRDISYVRLPDGSSNWTNLLSPTPGWQNNKRDYHADYSLLTILLLSCLVSAISILCVAISKLNARRK